MGRWLCFLVLTVLLSLTAGDTGKQNMEMNKTKHTNHLAQEKSPYLLQHAHNPVDWYAWGSEAFEKAKKEDKPIFLSIGYSTCHWCHVMERESFENEKIAKIMNENFVSIKVDREERPDIDQIYMTAVQTMTGGGGWPLSAFLTSDLEPFYGGTYFPPERRWGRPGFDEILREISRMWKEERAKCLDSGRDLAGRLKAEKASAGGPKLSEDVLKKAYFTFKDMFDSQDGGFGAAPKFPRSETISLLFRIYRRTGEKHAYEMATKTLEKMARGGMYDQLGGGFHRYATDAQWLVPHFEKMLYDNALLVRSYLEAYVIDKNEMWAGVARETLDYVLRDMTSSQGGFYSAEDADSEGVEGKFYVWSEDELKKILTVDEFKKIKEIFQTSPEGNFEGKNILHPSAFSLWSVRYQPPLAAAMKKLFQVREERIHPHKDDKIIASWNGLMISAMAMGAQVLGDEGYLEAARRAADFILTKMWDGKVLKRRYREGDVRFQGSVDDHAFLIQGLLDLYETDFDPRWFEAACALQKKADELFWDSKGGGYFYTDTSDPTLLTRTKDVYDGAVPSGNSIAAHNLLRFYDYTLEDNYQKKAEVLFDAFSNFVSQYPHASPAFLMAVDYATDASQEIVLAGPKKDPEMKALLRDIWKRFLPNKVLAVADPRHKDPIPLLEGKGMQDNRLTLYLCQNHACGKPVHALSEIEGALQKTNSFSLSPGRDPR